jgi:hypothetical protein
MPQIMGESSIFQGLSNLHYRLFSGERQEAQKGKLREVSGEQWRKNIAILRPGIAA